MGSLYVGFAVAISRGGTALSIRVNSGHETFCWSDVHTESIGQTFRPDLETKYEH